MISASVVVDKPRLLIVGAGGHGCSVAEAVVMLNHYELVGFLDDAAFALGREVWGRPVIGSTSALANFSGLASHAIVAIGNNVLRQNLCDQLQAAGFTLASVLHPKSIISPSAQIGEGVVVMAGAIVGTEAVLMKGAIVNFGAVIDHHAHVNEFGHLGVNACMAAGCVLGALAWMQAGSALGNGVQLPAGAVIGVGVGIEL